MSSSFGCLGPDTGCRKVDDKASADAAGRIADAHHALEVAHQVEVMDLIRHLSGRLNLGVVVILHDINIASRYCDRIVALNAGQLALDGSPEELMREDALKAIYSVEMQVMPHPLRDHTIAVMK